MRKKTRSVRIEFFSFRVSLENVTKVIEGL